MIMKTINDLWKKSGGIHSLYGKRKVLYCIEESIIFDSVALWTFQWQRANKIEMRKMVVIFAFLANWGRTDRQTDRRTDRQSLL